LRAEVWKFNGDTGDSRADGARGPAVSRRRKPRLRCEECRMHRSLCICALLPRLETRTRVVLLLHQLEVDKPTNTGVVAARCLVNSAVVYRGRAPGGETGAAHAVSDVASDAASDEASGADEERDEAQADGSVGSSLEEQSARLAAAVPAGTRAAFLFPHETASPLESWRGGDTPVTLIVPDGTWSQAARARARLGRALALPCLTLPPEAVARQMSGATHAAGDAPAGRLRTPTRPGRLATLEAVALALGVLEGPQIEAALMRIFRVMTDRTLWTNGRLPREAVTGGVPAGVSSDDPLGARLTAGARRDRRTRAGP
jgi:DTW domain-containing protein YfiP